MGIMGLWVFSSCSNSKTYAEKLEDQEKAVESFIAQKGFTILYEMPKDTLTKENEFVKFSNELYLHIYKRGNLSLRPKKKETEICLRYKECLNLLNTADTSSYYGNWYTAHSSGSEFVYGLCDREGWDYPLQFLGDTAEVALIVPSSMGTSTQQNDVTPYYYGRVKYTFVK